MYLYGGVWEENGGRERLARDDLWSIDVTKLDEWTCLHADSGVGEAKFQIVEETDGASGGGGGGGGSSRRQRRGGETKGDDNEEVHDEEEEEDTIELTEEELLAEYSPEAICEMSPAQRLVICTCKKIDMGLIQLGGGRRNRHGNHGSNQGGGGVDELLESLGFGDAMTTPVGDEKLRDFFKRTADHWIFVVIQRMSKTGKGGGKGNKKATPLNGKELRRAAFTECEQRYHLLKPLVDKIYVVEQAQSMMEAAASHAGTVVDKKKEKKEKKKKDKKEKKKKKKKEKDNE